MINKAIQFAHDAHEGQFRKGTNIPYIVHPMRVMERLLRAGFSEEVAVAGLLHDVIEDCDVTPQDMEQHFGKRVTELVIKASEAKTEDHKRDASNWKQRKQTKINHLIDLDDVEAVAIIAADKTDNVSDMVRDFKKDPTFWKKFNAPYEEISWFYNSILNVINHKDWMWDSGMGSILYELIDDVDDLFPDAEYINIMYIHGFASCFDKKSAKVQVLSQLGSVEGITLDYTSPHAIIKEQLKNEVLKGEYDLIVGSSLGGYWASHIGTEFGIPFVAINPALNPGQTLQKYIGKGTTHFGEPFDLNQSILDEYGRFAEGDGCGLILLDEADEVLDANATMEEISKRMGALGSGYEVMMFQNGNHRFAHMKESIESIREFYNSSIVYGFGDERRDDIPA